MRQWLRKWWPFLGLLVATVAYAGVIVHGQLIDASLENLSADPTAHTGRVYYNTTSNVVKFYNGGASAWRTIVDTTTALSNPMTTTGDIIYSSDNSGTPARLAVGSAGKLLVGGSTPSWSNTVSAATTFSGGVAFNGGGTNLNWYEEGTANPAVACAGGGSVSVISAHGDFTRFGNRVLFNMYFRGTNGAGGSACAGNVTVTGLPYASSATTDHYQAVNVGYFRNATQIASAIQMIGYCDPGGTDMFLSWNVNSGTPTQMQGSAWGSGVTVEFMISGQYKI